MINYQKKSLCGNGTQEILKKKLKVSLYSVSLRTPSYSIYPSAFDEIRDWTFTELKNNSRASKWNFMTYLWKHLCYLCYQTLIQKYFMDMLIRGLSRSEEVQNLLKI